jgi:signal peptidase II
MNSKAARLALMMSLLVFIVGCDQVTKHMAQASLKSVAPLTYLGNTFRLEYSENKGAFLSLGAQFSESFRFWIFIVLVVVFLTIVVSKLLSSKIDLFSTIALSLIFAGGIGNLIDRVFNGYVVDFLNVGIGPIRTGIFNIADVAIMAGVFMLIFHHQSQKKTQASRSSNPSHE